MDRVHWQTVELLSPVPRGQWALGTELVVARNSAPANEAVAGRCQPGPSQKPEGTPLLWRALDCFSEKLLQSVFLFWP